MRLKKDFINPLWTPLLRPTEKRFQFFRKTVDSVDSMHDDRWEGDQEEEEEEKREERPKKKEEKQTPPTPQKVESISLNGVMLASH